jgi:F-box/leucine-rich repeat protein 10/11
VWCRGHKIFWLVPPTDKNLLLYEQWVKEQTDRTEFFGDLAEGCCRIEILAGQQLRSMVMN